MYKVTAVFFLSCILLFAAAGEKRDIQFSAGGNTGVMNSSIAEYVFRKNNADYPQVSRLDWDISALWFAEICSDISWRGFFAAGTVSIGFPGSSGKMQDYDWLNETSGILTNYSNHSSTVDRYLAGHIRAGYQFEFRGNGAVFKTGPLIGFTGRNLSQTASDGYRQYLPGESYSKDYADSQPVYALDPVAVSGDVVVYELQCFIPLAGWTATLSGSNFLCGFTFMMAPYLHINGYDTHIQLDKLFWDNMSGNSYVLIEFALRRRLYRTFALGVSVQYETMGVADGPTVLSDLKSGKKYAVNNAYGGCSFSALSVKLALMYWRLE